MSKRAASLIGRAGVMAQLGIIAWAGLNPAFQANATCRHIGAAGLLACVAMTALTVRVVEAFDGE